LQNARARSRLPPRAASPPGLSPLPRPPPSGLGRAGHLDAAHRTAGGRAAAASRPLSLHFPSRRPQQEARQPAERPHTGLRARGRGRCDPADPNSPVGCKGNHGWGGRRGHDLEDLSDPSRSPWVDTPPDFPVWTFLSNPERTEAAPSPHPFPEPGSVPSASSRLRSRQRA
jgi:hypothetical protein